MNEATLYRPERLRRLRRKTPPKARSDARSAMPIPSKVGTSVIPPGTTKLVASALPGAVGSSEIPLASLVPLASES